MTIILKHGTISKDAYGEFAIRGYHFDGAGKSVINRKEIVSLFYHWEGRLWYPLSGYWPKVKI